MPAFEFTVPGVPKSERKHQVRMGAHAKRVDTPDRVDWKVHIRACILQALPRDFETIEGPITLTVHYFRRKPKSYPKRPTKGNPFPFDWITKPDCTNMTKMIEDCITDMNVWRDDAQVVRQVIEKSFDDTPRTDVKIEWLTGQSESTDTSDAGADQARLSIG